MTATTHTPQRAPSARSSHWRAVAGQGAAVLAYTAFRRAHQRLRLARWMNFEVHQVIAIEPWRLRVPERPARGLEVGELAPGHAPLLAALRPSTGAAYAQRWADGHRAWGAWLGPRLVAFVWVCRGPVRLRSSLGCSWQVPASMAWVYDLYSDPGVLGAVPHLYAHLRRHPPGDRLGLLVGQTDSANHRSRTAHRSLGYTRRATLWTARLGGWGGHLVHTVDGGGGPLARARRWRWVRKGGLIPLHAVADAPAAAAAASADAQPLRLQCVCGLDRALGAQPEPCACGRLLARGEGNLLRVGEPVAYWGEIPEGEMERVLRRSEEIGWRPAVGELLTPGLAEYVGSPGRAAFEEILPLPPNARVLDVGAGWGAISAPLARRHRVVALEGVEARARFIALRQRQDGLANLQPVCADILRAPLGLGQFDAIIVNGVLEWVALMDTAPPPRAVQVQFLHRLRELLAPGGQIYLAIESRFSLAALRGELDHSGLPYTSLLPRALAHLVCRQTRRYRSEVNHGYRTYTYTHRGYRRLFAEAGLSIEDSWICPYGYNRPEKLIPLVTPAVRFSIGRGRAAGARHWLRNELARGWTCRLLGSTFAFRLRALPAETRHAYARSGSVE